MNIDRLTDVCVEHNIPPSSYFWTWNDSAEWQFRVVTREIKVPPSAHFFDFGCGALRLGSLLIPYLEDNHYCGVDAFPPFVEVAPRIMEILGVRKRYQLVLSEEFDFRVFARWFDFSFAQSVFTHINREDTRRCLLEMREVMQPGGRLYASVVFSGRRKAPIGMMYGGIHPFRRPAVPAGHEFYEELATDLGLTCERTDIKGGQHFLRFDFPGLPRATDDEELQGNRLEWISAIADGATTIESARTKTRLELSEYLDVDVAEVERLAAEDAEMYRRQGGAKLTQNEVTALARRARHSWVSNALGNVTKAADAAKAALRIHAVRQAEHFAHGGELVDYGCGAGALSLYAHSRGFRRITLAEVSDEQLDFAQWRLRRRGLEDVHRWNIIDEEAPGRMFDAVLLIDVLPVVADTAALVGRLRAVLADGGVIVVNFAPVPVESRDKWSYLIGEDPPAIREAFESAGFTVVFEQTLLDHTLCVYRLGA